MGVEGARGAANRTTALTARRARPVLGILMYRAS
ncbi:amino acid transporter, partial [Xanthomonas oryzae pv. oryzae]